MREMKDSGIEWVGNIPVSWNIVRMKNCISSHCSGAWGVDAQNNSNDIVCLRIADFDYKSLSFKNSDDLTIRNYNKQLIQKLRLAKGDILIEKSGGGEKTPVGRAVMFDKEYQALFANFMERIRVTQKSDSRYFLYILNAFYENRYVLNYIKQTIGIQNIDLSSLFSSEKIPFPPLPEQRAIAAYLDEQCTEINALSADIQSEIDTLEAYKRSVITEAVTKGLDKNVEMKDSGIEWVGEIPKHWQTRKGKYFLKYIQKPTRPDDDVITCFRDGEVTLRKKRREEGFTISLQEIGYQGIDVGDLIVHGMDGFAGAIGISDSRGKASPVLNVLDTKNNKRYVMYYLRNMAYNGIFLALSTGIRVRTCDTNWGKLRELPYILPPINEQNEIVKYIDGKLNITDALINDKKEQLSTLEAFKKSLIYEYVTGKKEVPSA